MSSRLNWGELERRPGVSIFAIGCCLAVTYVVAVTIFSSEQGPIIKGDAVGYYAYLRSFVFDQDVNFINDYQLLYESSEGQNVWLTARGGGSTGRPVMAVRWWRRPPVRCATTISTVPSSCRSWASPGAAFFGHCQVNSPSGTMPG